MQLFSLCSPEYFNLALTHSSAKSDETEEQNEMNETGGSQAARSEFDNIDM